MCPLTAETKVMDFKQYLKSRKNRVDAFLEKYLSSIDAPSRLLEAMRYSVFAGGKRLRPILAIAAYETCHTKTPCEDAAVVLGAAIEMIHTYSLIHDDLPAMDDDDFRRGSPTNHKVFGDAVAILAGDALLTQAFELLSDDKILRDIDPDRRGKIISEIARSSGSSGMVGGQVADILSEGRSIDRQALEDIHLRKTSALICASVVSGAILAGAAADKVSAMAVYGSRIGLAFQVADDILDVTGTQEELGKSTSDVTRDKKTYPALYGIENARRKAERLAAEAVGALDSFGEQAWGLRTIADYIVERKN